MKAMAATKLLAPMVVLILGAALPALAQTTISGFSCDLDLRDVRGVPPAARAIVETRATSKNCPNNNPEQIIQMTCDVLVPKWELNARVNTKRHVCLIRGDQCGVKGEVFVADNVHLEIEPVVQVVNGVEQVFGDAHLRCMNKKPKK